MTDRSKVEIIEVVAAVDRSKVEIIEASLAQTQAEIVGLVASELLGRCLHELSKAQVPEPPKLAEFLLILCSGSGKRAEAIQGDLCEQFTRDCVQMSVGRARRRYWSRVLVSLGPQIGRTIGRAVKWAAIISALKRIVIG